MTAPERVSSIRSLGSPIGSDNLTFTPDDSSVVVVDWQTHSVGLPAMDLA
jgi:hypothetical protein